MILSSCAASEHLPLPAWPEGALHVRRDRRHGELPSMNSHTPVLQTTFMCVRTCIRACIYSVCACACELSTEQQWRSKGNCGSQFSPPSMWVLGLNSRHQAWHQAPSPTQLPQQPALRSCNVLLGLTDDGEDAFSFNSCFPSAKFKGTADPTSSLHGWKGRPESGNGVPMALTGPQWQRQKETGLKCSHHQTQVFQRKACRGAGVGNLFLRGLSVQGRPCCTSSGWKDFTLIQLWSFRLQNRLGWCEEDRTTDYITNT